MEFMSVREAAEKWGITVRRVQVLCTNNRIKGQMRVGKTWIIPKDAVKPSDARIKSGKYIKQSENS